MEIRWEQEARGIGQDDLARESFCSNLEFPHENLNLDPRCTGRGRDRWAGGADQACFQGTLAQILTWATESSLPHHEPILWKCCKRLSNLLRVT